MNMYFIALVLPKVIGDKVRTMKRWMQAHYQCSNALKSPAHITLVPPFWMAEEKESLLINDLQQFQPGIFPLSTAGFSAFAPRTIFVAVRPSPVLDQLKMEMDVFFRDQEHYRIPHDLRPFHPHITIANRDLQRKDFAAAWRHFENRAFEYQWTVEGISLLRHNKKNWDVVYTSQFQ